MPERETLADAAPHRMNLEPDSFTLNPMLVFPPALLLDSTANCSTEPKANFRFPPAEPRSRR
jgi:hypothetical protein